MRTVAMPAGRVLCEQGEAVEEVYFPHTGLISLVILTSNGETAETATVGLEGAVGLHSGLGKRRSISRAITQIGGDFSMISAPDFRRIAGEVRAVRDLIECYTEVLWAEVQQIAACNMLHHAEARLCRWLLQCADRTNRETLFLTQEFLGQMLGINRTTVNFVAQPLQNKGYVKYARGKIEILDREGLAKSACECYYAIHHNNLPAAIGVSL